MNLTDHSKHFTLRQTSMPIRTVQTVSDGDCLCCLMFDEVSIRGNLHFSQKCGCIEGFEDLGNQGRASNVAIIPWSSCFVVSVKSGSNQYLTTWFTEALRAWGLLICKTGSCSHYVWDMTTNNQGDETVECFRKDTFIQFCSYIWSSPSA